MQRSFTVFLIYDIFTHVESLMLENTKIINTFNFLINPKSLLLRLIVFRIIN